MKIGQKVTFIEGITFPVEELKTFVINLNLPDPTKIYTIRNIEKDPNGVNVARFKEIFMGTNKKNGFEMGAPLSHLRVVDELFSESLIENLESESQKVDLDELVKI